MCLDYPPLEEAGLVKLKRELRLIPERHKEDAIQEAWVAHLEGGDPVLAMHRYKMAEKRHEEREIPASQLSASAW